MTGFAIETKGKRGIEDLEKRIRRREKVHIINRLDVHFEWVVLIYCNETNKWRRYLPSNFYEFVLIE